MNFSPPHFFRSANVLWSQERWGILAVFSSAFCFYLATVVVRWGQESAPALTPTFHVFVRFLLGWGLVIGLLIQSRERPQIQDSGWVALRAVANLLAVFCFYQAVQATGVAEANILNMTYPVFIVVLSWLGFGERDRLASWLTIVAFVGVVLVMFPGEFRWRLGNVWGLASGFIAAFAIISLNRARQRNTTHSLLFYVFGTGAVLSFVGFYDEFFWPNWLEARYLLGSGILSVIGQYGLTIGFRYVTPVEGSVISSTRILIAAILGPLLLAGESLTSSGWLGAALIFLSNVLLAQRLWQDSATHAKP